jgi:MOSC domain-containing protein YiiM
MGSELIQPGGQVVTKAARTGETPGREPRLVAIHAGKPRQLPAIGAGKFERAWRTGIFKDPVTEPRWLGRTNLEGDGQADLEVHGGPDKAVLANAAVHNPAWRDELGLADFGPGAFGENFTISGLDEWMVAIGDTFALGDAVVQVSEPRGPCWKLARRWARPDLPSRVLKSGRTGWYLRVLEEGTVAPGLALRLLERPAAEWTINRVNRASYGKDVPPSELEALADCEWLARGWRAWAAKRAAAARV